MKLYHVQYDGEPYYIQAESVAWAVHTWKDHVKEKWGKDYDGSEEPDSVALVHDEGVIIQSSTHGSTK